MRFLQPHTDGKGSSTHPGLVVGDPLDNLNRDYIIAQITSSDWRGNTDVTIQFSDPEFEATGLTHNSTIRCHKIFPVAHTAVHHKFGVIGPETTN